jgi:hypothetical protein
MFSLPYPAAAAVIKEEPAAPEPSQQSNLEPPVTIKDEEDVEAQSQSFCGELFFSENSLSSWLSADLPPDVKPQLLPVHTPSTSYVCSALSLALMELADCTSHAAHSCCVPGSSPHQHAAATADALLGGVLPAVSGGVPEAHAGAWWLAEDIPADTYMIECEQQRDQEELAVAVSLLVSEAW